MSNWRRSRKPPRSAARGRLRAAGSGHVAAQEDQVGRAVRPSDPLHRRGHLRAYDARNSRFAAHAGDRLLPRGEPSRLLHRHDVGAAVPRRTVRRRPARRGHVRHLVLVGRRRVPARRGVAIYLSEYARPKATAVLKPTLEILAAIPTVVLGYFALTFVTPLLRDIGLQVEIFNALSARLVLGIMLIPTVATLSEDAMAAVPRELRDGGYALGADKLQVSTRIVFLPRSPESSPLCSRLSRAVGETMIVLIAAGQLAQITFDPRETIETMTAFIGATGNGDVPRDPSSTRPSSRSG